MVAVIGDVHGCFYTLTNLIEKIEAEFPHAQIYLVGDLIDRGKYSCDVIDFVEEKKFKFTLGNHEYMFINYFRFPSQFAQELWFNNGAKSTLKSYEKRSDLIEHHLKLVEKAPLFFDSNDCFISHAGISQFYSSMISKEILSDKEKLKKLLSQHLMEDFGILWCRGPLMNIGKLQVVGHTRMFEPKYIKEKNVLYIDTGAIAGNKLSAAIIEDNNIIKFISVTTNKADIY
ncbi:MAG: metallophosphoesterase [Ignavibacterium sp.]|uniref:metallophosphoesterase n=1 Tax=Ignavibacterium sp. TaxID=2651167 RepID=UPI00404A4B63